MRRFDIIATIGKDYLVDNVENSEFDYPKAYKANNLQFKAILEDDTDRKFETLDIRFVKDNISVLVETKGDFTRSKNKSAENQLSAYVQYEKALTGNKVIAILANTLDDRIKVWRGAVSDSNLLENETHLRTMDEYCNLYSPKVNDKEKVMQSTYTLNNLLHKYSIPEKLRSQFVGTCLLALKNNLEFESPKLSATQIRTGIKEKLDDILRNSNSDAEKAYKVGLLYKNVLENQNVRTLEASAFREILYHIKEQILPFINDKSTAGQDLLNLFFITFNKYVGKADKNQAFTPDHITDFMTKITGVNYKSRILDPCCGSGSFLVRAMTQALDDCPTEKDQKCVKEEHIFGIEYDENIFGLATTNMLIHSDGNSNIVRDSCFNRKDWIIETAKPTVILMNPPYNAQRSHMPKEYVATWKADQKEDPSKGLYFVKYVADIINEMKLQATLAVLLPVACAIGSKEEITKMKSAILENNTLDAVFTLPGEIFHPGASASACCMVFKLGKKHNDISNPDTFFGRYIDDGFKKKKNLGRVEQVEPATGLGKWESIEKTWIDLYRNRIAVPGLTAVTKVTGKDEWLCEAYMKTDFSQLTDTYFEQVIRDFMVFLIKEGDNYEF